MTEDTFDFDWEDEPPDERRIAVHKYPQFRGFDTGEVFYAHGGEIDDGDGEFDPIYFGGKRERLQDYPDLMEQILALCAAYFEGKED